MISRGQDDIVDNNELKDESYFDYVCIVYSVYSAGYLSPQASLGPGGELQVDWR